MDRALYGADGFYSARGFAGRSGDFLTAVEMGPLFSKLIGRYLDAVWAGLGRPDTFEVVEVGAGRGTLAAQLLHQDLMCGSAMRYRCVEISTSLRAKCAERVGSDSRVVVAEELPNSVRGVVIANELLDNLPFRVLERSGGAWSEWWVEDVSLVPCPTTETVDVDRDGVFPFQERAARWVDDALGRLSAGELLCFDYAVERYDDLPEDGWLRTYVEHERGHDPLTYPAGAADVTADVVIEGLPGNPRCWRMSDWCEMFGLSVETESAHENWAALAHIGNLEAMRARSTLNEAAALRDPSAFGSFWAMMWRA